MFLGEKKAVQMMDKIYRHIILTEDVSWLVALLGLYPRCHGIVMATLNRLDPLTNNKVNRTTNQEGTAAEQTTQRRFFSLLPTKCCEYTVTILLESMSYVNVLSAGLKILTILSRPLTEVDAYYLKVNNYNSVEVARRGAIDTAKVAECVMAVAGNHSNNLN